MPTGTGGNTEAIGFTNLVTVGVSEVEYVRDGKPVWDDVTLAIADAIRSCEPIARVPVPKQLGHFGLESPSVGHWLDQLRRDVPFVHIELRDLQKHQEAEAQIHQEGTKLIDRGRRMLRQRSGETLHAALRGYVDALRKKHVDLEGRVTSTGTTQAARRK